MIKNQGFAGFRRLFSFWGGPETGDVRMARIFLSVLRLQALRAIRAYKYYRSFLS